MLQCIQSRLAEDSDNNTFNTCGDPIIRTPTKAFLGPMTQKFRQMWT
jgi:hypothetical protein